MDYINFYHGKEFSEGEPAMLLTSELSVFTLKGGNDCLVEIITHSVFPITMKYDC